LGLRVLQIGVAIHTQAMPQGFVLLLYCMYTAGKI